ncbi:MAG: FlgD immunoglobulin-like domain containing protein, partial [Candidatus Krumholzibacteria bacterium]|nr:FlgD immunoglobulin-like domain containing protein [Candidatus Krumholzibacteria bacterium]
ATGALILPSPRSTGLPPYCICFSREEAAGADQAPAATLGRAFPNPFNPSTSIPFSLAAPARVELAVYDARGALVRALVSETLGAGSHEASWDGRGRSGRDCPSGIYFARLKAGSGVTARKLVLLR